MIVCDRCGNKIIRSTDDTKNTVTIYRAQGAYIGHYVDLCEKCIREFDDYIGKAQSYFMVNKENPIGIFDGVKYWDENS